MKSGGSTLGYETPERDVSMTKINVWHRFYIDADDDSVLWCWHCVQVVVLLTLLSDMLPPFSGLKWGEWLHGHSTNTSNIALYHLVPVPKNMIKIKQFLSQQTLSTSWHYFTTQNFRVLHYTRMALHTFSSKFWFKGLLLLEVLEHFNGWTTFTGGILRWILSPHELLSRSVSLVPQCHGSVYYVLTISTHNHKSDNKFQIYKMKNVLRKKLEVTGLDPGTNSDDSYLTMVEQAAD